MKKLYFKLRHRNIRQKIMRGDVEAVKAYIKAGHPIDSEVKDKMVSLLACAYRNQQMEIVQLLLEAGATIGIEDLHYAQKDSTLLDILLTAGVKAHNSSVIHEVMAEGYFSYIEGLLDKYGNNSLHLACLYGSLEAVKHMTGRVDINAKNLLGDTALHIACAHASSEIVNYLLSCGADIGVKNHDGHIALDTTENYENIKILIGCCDFLCCLGIYRQAIEKKIEKRTREIIPPIASLSPAKAPSGALQTTNPFNAVPVSDLTKMMIAIMSDKCDVTLEKLEKIKKIIEIKMNYLTLQLELRDTPSRDKIRKI